MHYPLNLIKKLPPEATKVGAYPVALIPGQYQDHYKPYVFYSLALFREFVITDRIRRLLEGNVFCHVYQFIGGGVGIVSQVNKSEQVYVLWEKWSPCGRERRDTFTGQADGCPSTERLSCYISIEVMVLWAARKTLCTQPV